MHEGKCTGRCVSGIILAIFFGAFFLWILILGYRTQVASPSAFAPFLMYLVALVFLALAKLAKHWSCGCGCRMEMTQKAPVKRKGKK